MWLLVFVPSQTFSSGSFSHALHCLTLLFHCLKIQSKLSFRFRKKKKIQFCTQMSKHEGHLKAQSNSYTPLNSSQCFSENWETFSSCSASGNEQEGWLNRKHENIWNLCHWRLATCTKSCCLEVLSVLSLSPGSPGLYNWDTQKLSTESQVQVCGCLVQAQCLQQENQVASPG